MYGSARNKKRMKHAAHTLLVPPFGHVVGSESETSWPLPNDASWALTTHPSESLLVPCAQSPQTLITKRANVVHIVCTTRSHLLWCPKGSCVEEGETHFWEGIRHEPGRCESMHACMPRIPEMFWLTVSGAVAARMYSSICVTNFSTHFSLATPRSTP